MSRRDVDKCAFPVSGGRSCPEESAVIYCGVGICDRHWDDHADDLTPEDFRQREILKREADPKPDRLAPGWRPRKKRK